MNYRHHFHAGNYADVIKHALLVRLVRALQKKDKGFLYLDTHAGRGRYDLERASAGDSLVRKPEWPDGIGRLWSLSPDKLPPMLLEYCELVRSFDRRAGNLEPNPRFYPGSPWIVRAVARDVDRIALCEKHPDEFAALRSEFARQPRTSLHEIDGYSALRAMLPPPERRALVLIDPPFEAQDEFSQIVAALRAGLARFPTGVMVVWYPLTVRARVDEFLSEVRAARAAPALAVEVMIAGESSPLKMKGCGLLVLNPPWQFEAEADAIARYLAESLAQAPDGGAQLDWVVAEE
jgi:23S rRNA (adenine2030-N6)-methyltransferase